MAQLAFSPVGELHTEKTARLMPDVQFLYELHLARLELVCLAGEARMGDDYRTLFLPATTNEKEVLSKSAYCGDIDGQASSYAKLIAFNITRSFNQYLTHWFYPYKGKFHPQMIRALINIIGLQPGDLLLDPFIGSGTTAVEGALMGLRVCGEDVSPLCALISLVKTNSVHRLPAIEESMTDLLTINEAKCVIDESIDTILNDPVVGFKTLAKLIALSDSVKRRRDFAACFENNLQKMLHSIRLMQQACAATSIEPQLAQIKIGDARQLPYADASMDGVITSPPYSLALDYIVNDAHSLQALGWDLQQARAKCIGARGQGKDRYQLYEQDMERAYAEIARVLKPGKMAAIVLGNSTLNGEEIATSRHCQECFDNLGLKQAHKINKIIFGLYNVMRRENILIFQKN